MKKDFGVKNWIFPMPVLMIGTYNEDGTADMMNAAWGGITYDDQITICIGTAHKTWKNIAARKSFTVAFGTAETVRQCDYLGITSGNDTPDKVARCGFTPVKGKFADAPVMEELPLVLECELVSMDKALCKVVG
ncbi:MAG: flavin reductase, partial [Lentisphaeria bacterium]|nr:flavin reductase [Lentisphaeria bacterium]